MASLSSRAAASGRLSCAGSASGTACACSGVSMSPGSSDRKRTPSAASSSPQMRTHVTQCGLRRAVRAPLRIGVDRRVARYVEHDRAATLPSGGGQRTQQRLGKAERSQDVGLERHREVFALGVGEKGKRCRSQARRVVDEHVESAERGGNLQGDGVDVVLACDVAHDAVGARELACNPVNVLTGARDEGDAGAASTELTDEREAEARRAACNGHSQWIRHGRRLQVKVSLKSSPRLR